MEILRDWGIEDWKTLIPGHFVIRDQGINIMMGDGIGASGIGD